MKTLSMKRAVNGIVWISSGVILIVLRAMFYPGVTTLAWEIIGGVMIAYGATRLVWGFIRSGRSSSTIP